MAEQQGAQEQCWRVVVHERNAGGWWTLAPQRYATWAAAQQHAMAALRPGGRVQQRWRLPGGGRGGGAAGVDQSAGGERVMKATVEVVRAALGDALATGTGQVVLTVFREGQEPLGAALDPVTWGAVWDALALDPDDGAGEGQTP